MRRIPPLAIGLLVPLCAASIPRARAETVVARGAYLVEALAACAGCHTPKGDAAAPLSGGSRFGPPTAGVYAANLTPDKANGLGDWSDRAIVDAIRNGLRPDGSRIAPPMPQWAYRGMTDADAEAIVAYLRSVAPSAHVVPRAPRAVSLKEPRVPQVDSVPPVATTDPVERGRYIATSLAHCTECHTPVSPIDPDFAHRLDTGGRRFDGPDGPLVAPGITAASLAGLSDPELAAIIIQGRHADGSSLRGPMPWRSYARMTREDLGAVIAFLRQAPPPPQATAKP